MDPWARVAGSWGISRNVARAASERRTRNVTDTQSRGGAEAGPVQEATPWKGATASCKSLAPNGHISAKKRSQGGSEWPPERQNLGMGINTIPSTALIPGPKILAHYCTGGAPHPRRHARTRTNDPPPNRPIDESSREPPKTTRKNPTGAPFAAGTDPWPVPLALLGCLKDPRPRGTTTKHPRACTAKNL